jgi:hypothetical protein
MLRIVTENKNLTGIKKILAHWNLDYTMFPAIGSWKGVEEPSLVIEICGFSRWIVKSAAKDILVTNFQESVLLQEFSVNSEFITATEVKVV